MNLSVGTVHNNNGIPLGMPCSVSYTERRIPDRMRKRDVVVTLVLPKDTFLRNAIVPEPLTFFYPMQTHFHTFVVFVCFAALLAGCSRGGVRVYEVKGTIQWDGQPVEGAVVFFYPEDIGNTSINMAQGITDKQGNFRLSTAGGEVGKGAMAGSYKVAVMKGPPEGVVVDHPSKASVLPIVYADAGTTPLKAEVLTRKNVCDFTLEGKSPYAR